MEDSSPEALALRAAFGSFATGITVVTTRGPDGQYLGMTVNSFSSVSLAPPLVLWCVAQDAFGYEAFAQAEHFAIHVLAEDQQSLSEIFAQRGSDKFHNLAIKENNVGVPLLQDCATCFQCQIEHRYAGGDHMILVARVLDFNFDNGRPLLYYRGQYCGLA